MRWPRPLHRAGASLSFLPTKTARLVPPLHDRSRSAEPFTAGPSPSLSDSGSQAELTPSVPGQGRSRQQQRRPRLPLTCARDADARPPLLAEHRHTRQRTQSPTGAAGRRRVAPGCPDEAMSVQDASAVSTPAKEVSDHRVPRSAGRAGGLSSQVAACLIPWTWRHPALLPLRLPTE